ncbi:MAG: arginine deiminase-related protein [Raineya sp.]|nr:arginine deiminase-related protein [Raineya sp.]
MHTTSHLLLVRPAAFGYNPETAATNVFQKTPADFSPEIHQKALQEFENMVKLLQENDVNLLIAEDTPTPYKPDAMFPNNWITTHQDGTIVLYPLQAPNRRAERREEIINMLKNKYKVRNVINLTHYESRNKFLEGTGSLVFDHHNKIAYASLSPRTHAEVVDRFCNLMNYKSLNFQALDEFGQPIYHTNVVMSMGDKFVIICFEAIKDEIDQEDLLNSFRKTQKEIIKISYEQMKNFLANCIEISNNKGEHLLLLSQRAYDSLEETQKKRLESYVRLLPCPLDTIETYAGGSARCMIVEIFLPTF